MTPTPHRPIRINDALWAKVKAKAKEQDTTASAAVRRLLTEWVDQKEQP